MQKPFIQFALALMVCSTTLAAAPDTQQQLQELFDNKQYKELQPRLNHALSLTGPAARQYNHFGLLVLKAETTLRLSPGKPANDAFTAAVAAAPDEPARMSIRAIAALVSRSPKNLYKPLHTADGASATGSQEPIDILEPDNRTRAMDALRVDLLAVAETDADRAAMSTTLDPILRW